MLQLASSREPPLASTLGPIFPHNLGRRMIFAIFGTLISRKPLKISKNRDDVVNVKFEDLQILVHFIFSKSLTVLKYFGFFF